MTSASDACPLPLGGGDEAVKDLLLKTRVIAVVGMSPKPDRPSYEVGCYLLEQGYQVIPVHPKAERIGELEVYPSLEAIPGDLTVDLVDLFVAGDRTAELVEQTARIKAPAIWFQPGAENPASEARARELGLAVISGRCTKAEHQRLIVR